MVVPFTPRMKEVVEQTASLIDQAIANAEVTPDQGYAMMLRLADHCLIRTHQIYELTERELDRVREDDGMGDADG